MENIEENNVVIEENNVDNVEPIVENNIEKNKDFTNQLQKPKKPRTQKQIDALKKAQETRKLNIEKRKKEKLMKTTNQVAGIVEMNENIDTEDLIEKHKEELKKLALSKHTKELSKPKPIPKKKKQPKIVYQENDDSSSEEEIIYIPKSRKKKKKKKIIRHETSSSEEEEEPQENVASYYAKPKLRYSDVFRFQ
jgi:hypothetical protein